MSKPGPADLPHAGQPQAKVPTVRVPTRPVVLELLRQYRAGADEGHLTQDDIHELGQLRLEARMSRPRRVSRGSSLGRSLKLLLT